jgi:hypothetical protein
MSDYIESKDREYDSQTQDYSVMGEYLKAKDAEEEVDDRSVMQIYLDSKDAEEL